MNRPVEAERRKPGADGVAVRLADGGFWLLARPVYLATPGGLTHPDVDRPLDRIFEGVVSDRPTDPADVFEAAAALLRANYRLTRDETSHLLTESEAAGGAAVAEGVVQALLGLDPGGRTYTRWVRASLLANGLGTTGVPADDLAGVLAILVATNRTIPVTKFTDACRAADERARLDILI